MKNIFKLLGVALLGVMSACSPDDVEGLDANKRPNADELDATITVDQNTNQVTMTLNNKGITPIWRVYKTEKPVISTRTTYSDIITVAGTYTIELQAYNHHGVCDGMKTYTVTLDNTIIDWSRYVTPLTGGNGASKVWRMDNQAKGHLGCGEPGSDGTNWWAAGPDEKAGFGMYENRLTFTDTGAGDGSGKYLFDGGESGTVYVNKGVTEAPFGASNPGDDNDYVAPMANKETTFQFVSEGADLFITFPAETPLIYVPSIDAYKNPKFKVLKLTGSAMELVYIGDGINWHYTLTSKEPEQGGGGENTNPNLVDNATFSLKETYTADDNWQPIENAVDVTVNGHDIHVVYNQAPGTQQWQAQVKIATDIALKAGQAYDIAFAVSATNAIPNMVFKVEDTDADGNQEGIELKQPVAGSDEFEYKAQINPADTEGATIVFDFAGVPAGTEIDVTNISIKESMEGSAPEPDIEWVAVDSPDNLLNGAAWNHSFFWADDSWEEVATPSFTLDGGVITLVTAAANGGSQWQGQLHLQSGVAISADKHYDFRITFNIDNTVGNVTVKPHPDGDDGTFFSEDRHAIEPYEDTVVKLIDCAGFDTNNLVVTLDIPGCPANANIVIKDIILQEHK